MKKLTSIGLVTLVSALALVAGCEPEFSDGGNGGNSAMNCDKDNDGHADQNCEGNTNGKPADDCDDSNPARFPGHDEVCDEKDNDCDFQVDEGVANCTPPKDSDGDGVPDNQDCAPNDASVCPGHAEVCGDQKDNDCDNLTDEDCGQTTGNCGSCGQTTGNGNPTGGSGTMCTVRFEWSTSEIAPTGAGYVFGGFNPPSSGYIDHWSNPGKCVPNGNGPLCALVKNGSVWSCSTQVESDTALVFVLGMAYTPSDTDCMWSFDEGCWDGGGCSADNGLTRVFVNNVEKSLVQVENPDQFPETDNGRVWVDCN